MNRKNLVTGFRIGVTPQGRGSGRLQLDCDFNERQRGAAERLVFAEHQGQIALDAGVGER